jgi:hypothetical protein
MKADENTVEIDGKRYKKEDLDFNGNPYKDARPVGEEISSGTPGGFWWWTSGKAYTYTWKSL